MDGYHFSIAQLKTKENPEDVIYRRGAPDTFDANSLRRDLSKIRHGDEKQVFIPCCNFFPTFCAPVSGKLFFK